MWRWPFLLALGIALAACTSKGVESFKSTDVTGAEFARDFALTDHDGAARRLADFKGKVVVVFFGFTHCPDVCPTTLAEITKAIRQLGPAAKDRVQVLFVTVDPERDKPELLKQYVTAFDPAFLGLWGNEQDIERTTREFKVVAMKNGDPTSGKYSVDHSTQTFVYDPQGRLRLFVPHKQLAEALAHDIALLLK